MKESSKFKVQSSKWKTAHGVARPEPEVAPAGLAGPLLLTLNLEL
jgi:hypothetical protein